MACTKPVQPLQASMPCGEHALGESQCQLSIRDMQRVYSSFGPHFLNLRSSEAVK